MTFKLLEQIAIADGGTTRLISLYEGDLAAIPADHAVDLLIVSAFPNSYHPTPGTLIEALHRSGLSVATFARNKMHDLRGTTAFWLSQPILASAASLNIGQIACFEPGVLGSAPELVRALFRGLFPFLQEGKPNAVALPLLATGNQNFHASTMLVALLDAACHWLQRGLAIGELKIVLRPSAQTEVLAAVMYGFKAARQSALRDAEGLTASHDVFLSYSSKDGEAAAIVAEALKQRTDVRTVFDYRLAIEKGASWQRELDRAIASCRSIVALLTPDYFASSECIEELMQGRLRNKKSPGNVLLPIYWRELGQELDLWLQVINYLDCRESDAAKLSSSIRAIGAL
jgi:hypothetical protein